MLALTVIYRVARPQEDSMRNVLPGAMVATLLWWLVDVLFGIYVRRVPYSVVYGGLAPGICVVRCGRRSPGGGVFPAPCGQGPGGSARLARGRVRAQRARCGHARADI